MNSPPQTSLRTLPAPTARRAVRIQSPTNRTPPATHHTVRLSPASLNPDGTSRTFYVRTLGCQMNVHDSERIAGSMLAAGYTAHDSEDADVVIINTCAVRENAANRLYGNLGMLASKKKEKEGMQIAVGGCLAQMQREQIFEHAPCVDVIFGTHNLSSLPILLERARHNSEAQIEIEEALKVFPSALPAKRFSRHSAWVSISVGCNNTCTFCIVPSLRGKEKDRRPGDILAEISALVADGAVEVTLLGQNVNTYGVEFGDRSAFSKLLCACGNIEGLKRVRFTSPHPAAFTLDVIDAMADTENVMPSLHMPLQSGSDAILQKMRRSYRTKKFLSILDSVRNKIPHAAITTDIIVGFPGETDSDFEQTLKVVEQARFASAFTFQYSPRAGTPAASMPEQVPKEVVQERFDRLLELQRAISLEENKKFIGENVEILVSSSQGKKDTQTGRITGRARDGRLVHFTPLPPAPDNHPHQGRSVQLPLRSSLSHTVFPHISHNKTRPLRPGDFVNVTITAATPANLISDATPTPF